MCVTKQKQEMKNTDEKMNEKNQETRELFRTVSTTDQLSESFLHDVKPDDKDEKGEEQQKERDE
jgi:hypothetical protein